LIAHVFERQHQPPSYKSVSHGLGVVVIHISTDGLPRIGEPVLLPRDVPILAAAVQLLHDLLGQLRADVQDAVAYTVFVGFLKPHLSGLERVHVHLHLTVATTALGELEIPFGFVQTAEVEVIAPRWFAPLRFRAGTEAQEGSSDEHHLYLGTLSGWTGAGRLTDSQTQ
jgi:hypothetical protein